MRYGCKILLCTIVVFLVEITVVTSIQDINNNVRTVPNVATMTTLQGTSTRLLRPNSTKTGDADEVSQERVGLGGILSKVGDLVNKLFKGTSTADTAAIQALLRSKVHPTELFSTLRLGLGAARLDDNPELLQWFRLAAAYRKRNGDQALPDLEIYFMLLRQHQARDVESLIQKLKNTTGLKKLGISMENSLSGSWINKALKRQTGPKALFNSLRLKEAGAKLDETPLFYQWLQYVESYRTIKGYAWFGSLDMLLLFRKTIPAIERR
ncbi:hypothetical protein P3T76_006969 [Phytophthora citrophthora]|uniref:RXLR phytopathogen effector protein WY-domain domain-containing protein n=1 Tax=Phytophthora citrophthora TaxID=4793 RepID=A0AAD9GNK0_9STRA|nr:hypothetical protein P3T76_006969 [Phytophthora citrophthora]